MPRPHPPPAEVDEESLVHQFSGLDRKATGVFFTPAPLVERTLALALPYLGEGPLAVVDPACGAGAFLAATARLRPDARLCGLELDADVARMCHARIPSADIRPGDALRDGLEPLLAAIPPNHRELWIGNPPYNGTSALLKDRAAYARLRALLPRELPAGTSLRDDFAFFLLVAASRLATRPGVLAFITPSSLLESFLYAPLRHALLETLSLREVVDLGPGAFAGTQVRTCITVWTSPPGAAALPRFERQGQTQSFHPEAPEWRLVPISPEAVALDTEWRAEGELLDALVPVSLPGVKTRFDELLVDEDPERLLLRVRAFAACPRDALTDFAKAHGLPLSVLSKLHALKEGAPLDVDASHLRPFFRYGGARHRGTVPPEARAYCYLDRRLIPRGDHRLRGPYDPHLGAVKLLFNVRELPLSAALLEEEGCVHDHRHARFAPLFVPERIRDHGLGVTRAALTREELGPLVPNLSVRGRAWADTVGGPAEAFGLLVRFLNSEQVQQVWAPAFGASRVVPVPLAHLSGVDAET
ncbi:SAM-dependent DNA methyltransferase [Corallococcus sp. H22C18031201]|uniref:N-6 DNA methylase n=1 Tax=Citreicoccus inhibens TaxID=2849499 RepID=UPI000E74A4BD|nr:N-6 DNA methylase [Citreicoccus inhibens]MBU8896078.1 SAM-dependent methyltransferase [Citreicoccus inhibens]RJS25948.1 SAM-dependent DNA methyltransferase [Corallococcus sp. H22C18031201]